MEVIFFKKTKKDNLLNKFVNWAINFFDGSFVHCEIKLSDGDRYTAFFGEGVVKNKEYPQDQVQVYLRASSNLTIDEEACKLFLENQVGKDYDLIGILFSLIFPLNIQNEQHWFCSELVRKALRVASIPLDDIIDSRFSPNSLFKELSENVNFK